MSSKTYGYVLLPGKTYFEEIISRKCYSVLLCHYMTYTALYVLTTNSSYNELCEEIHMLWRQGRVEYIIRQFIQGFVFYNLNSWFILCCAVRK